MEQTVTINPSTICLTGNAMNQPININELPAELIRLALIDYIMGKYNGFSKAKALAPGELLLVRFERFINEGRRDKVFGSSREAIYRVLLNCLKRFLIINRKEELLVQEVTVDILMKFFDFMRNEHLYVKHYPQLYKGMLKQNIPMKPRRHNTVATRAQMLKTFFIDLETREEIDKSPFRRMSRERQKTMRLKKYGKPVCLTALELAILINANVPKELENCRIAFVLQCAFGCRISDFMKLSMKNVAVSECGIPYIHYLPVKTAINVTEVNEIQTPIMYYALKIIKETHFKLPILQNLTGKSGYNVQIKRLLKYCGISRPCEIYNEQTEVMETKPLWSLGSSKLARKTHVDMLNKVQIDKYAAGLHARSSESSERYTDIGLDARFKLMCAAYNQPVYKVDKHLNVIE